MHSLHKLDLRSPWRHYPLFARDGADLAHYAEIFLRTLAELEGESKRCTQKILAH